MVSAQAWLRVSIVLTLALALALALTDLVPRVAAVAAATDPPIRSGAR
jgi:hypothetical protein